MNENGPGAAPAAPAEAAAPSPFGALAGTFASPAATFAGLVRRPTWWLPLVLWLAGIGVVVLVTTPKIDMERTFREMFEKRAEKTGQSISDEQIREMVARSDRSAAKSAAIAVPSSAVVFLLVALVLWGGARASGSEATFGQTMAVWAHANLANVVGVVLAVPILAGIPDASETQFSVQRVVRSNVGAFLPADVPAFLGSIAGSIDIFSIAALVLLVIGMKKLPAMPPGAAVGVPVGLWALYVLGKAGLAAAFLG